MVEMDSLTLNNKTKLILAIHQIDNIMSLLQENEWKEHLYYHLIITKVELQRQLSLEV